ncbi:hypothetical protein U9M48_011533 [Paspalum notatum var. saurae]|uniref:Uncharacterized protein n=1 Tax=Paspalum notatum var. saurae TaxID=547442 RepID=A0AAQ3SVX1_PASNO
MPWIRRRPGQIRPKCEEGRGLRYFCCQWRWELNALISSSRYEQQGADIVIIEAAAADIVHTSTMFQTLSTGAALARLQT